MGTAREIPRVDLEIWQSPEAPFPLHREKASTQVLSACGRERGDLLSGMEGDGGLQPKEPEDAKRKEPFIPTMAGVKKGWRRQREEVRTQKPGTDSCSHWGWKNTDKMTVTGPAISQQAFSPRTRTSSLLGSALELRKCVREQTADRSKGFQLRHSPLPPTLLGFTPQEGPMSLAHTPATPHSWADRKKGAGG